MNNLKNPNYWKSHPIAYVDLYMRFDFFQMALTDFTSKYMLELIRTKNQTKKDAILPIINDIWDNMNVEKKFEVVNTIAKTGTYLDTLHRLMSLNDIMQCDFIKNTYERIYFCATGKNYND